MTETSITRRTTTTGRTQLEDSPYWTARDCSLLSDVAVGSAFSINDEEVVVEISVASRQHGRRVPHEGFPGHQLTIKEILGDLHCGERGDIHISGIDLWGSMDIRHQSEEEIRLGRMWTRECHLSGATNTDIALRNRFLALAKAWREETGMLSSPLKKSQHPAYQEVIAIGEAAVPLILEELSNHLSHWFPALVQITKENPVPEEKEGHVKEMADIWIKWGRERGYDL